ncbi:hypothetical protein [Singulisphaera sp. PoT]|uniref:hypothetical protein n=1 Tax=Singulisphaera sp. PoT TaxID=3411797 RepID=UPI003BF4865D
MILPSTPDLLSLDALRRNIEVLRELKAERYKVLLTKIRPNSRDGDVAQSMLRDAGVPVFDGMIRLYQAFVTAASYGQLVEDVKDERAHYGAEDYEAVGKELTS